jgi:hypothetical protein
MVRSALLFNPRISVAGASSARPCPHDGPTVPCLALERRPLVIMAVLTGPARNRAPPDDECAAEEAVALGTIVRAHLADRPAAVLSALAGEWIVAFSLPAAAIDAIDHARAAAASIAAAWREQAGTSALAIVLAPAADALVRRAADAGAVPLVVHRALAGARAEAEAACRTLQVEGARTLIVDRIDDAPELGDHLTGLARLDRTGSRARLLRILAVLGDGIDVRTLSTVLDQQPAAVSRSLTQLRRCGLLATSSSGAGDRVGIISDALLEAAARRSVGSRDAALISGVAARALAGSPNASDAAIADKTAALASRGRLPALAFRSWTRAANAAIAQSALQKAVGYLERALAERAAAIDAISLADEIEVQRQLAALLAAVHGNAAPVAVAAYRRSQALAERYAGSDAIAGFDQSWGILVSHLVAGRVRLATTLARRLVGVATEAGRDDLRLVAERCLGLARLLDGRLADARAILGNVVAGYRAERHAHLRYRFSSDQKALALAGLAWVETIAGRKEQAAQHAAAASAVSTALQHPHTSAHVFGVLASAAYASRRLREARALATVARAVADEHGFVYWVAWCDIMLGGAAAADGDPAGLATIENALASYTGTGAAQALPFAELVKAEAAARLGRPQLALATLERAIAGRGAGREVRLHQPALLLAAAQLAWGCTGGQPRAVELLHAAWRLADRQGAGLYVARVIDLLLEWKGGPQGNAWLLREALASGIDPA